MADKKKHGRRRKADWLDRAIEVLGNEGFDGVRVERLARDLKVAKSGFYWHFKDRSHLHKEMVEFWEHEYTEVVTSNEELAALPPAERLLRTTNMIVEHDLTKYDLSFRAWSQNDSEILAAVKRVFDRRLSWLRQIFRELGFTGAELEMRTRLYVGYQSWERTAFPGWPKSQAKRLVKRRIEFFIRP